MSVLSCRSARTVSTLIRQLSRCQPKSFYLSPLRLASSAKREGPTKDKPSDDDVDNEAPVKYSTSKAHEHSPFDTFLVSKGRYPFYQPYIVLISTSVFLIYFCVLREENDIDNELSKSLFEKIPGLEEKSIVGQINNARDLGEDTRVLEKHLQQVREATVKVASKA